MISFKHIFAASLLLSVTIIDTNAMYPGTYQGRSYLCWDGTTGKRKGTRVSAADLAILAQQAGHGAGAQPSQHEQAPIDLTVHDTAPTNPGQDNAGSDFEAESEDEGSDSENEEPRKNVDVLRALYGNAPMPAIHHATRQGIMKRCCNKIFGRTWRQRAIRTMIYTGAIFGILKGAGTIWQPTDASNPLWKTACNVTDGFWHYVGAGTRWTGRQLGAGTHWGYNKIASWFTSTPTPATTPTAIPAPTTAELLAHEQCVNKAAENGLADALQNAGRRAKAGDVLKGLKTKAQRGCYLTWERIKQCAAACLEKRIAPNNDIMTPEIKSAMQAACEDVCITTITTATGK